MTTHATLRALAYLRGGVREMYAEQRIQKIACDVNSWATEYDLYDHEAARGDRLPTCPACLVLWDEALERKKP